MAITAAAAAVTTNGNIDKRRRRRKQKKAKSNKAEIVPKREPDSDGAVEIEYVVEKPAFESENGPLADDFKQIFERFTSLASADKEVAAEDTKKKTDDQKDDDDDDEEQEDAKLTTSNKKKKILKRMTVGELKQLCSKPEVVEVWDATASDPRLLVLLKAHRNTVEVPRHWCQKRKFLQGKRGIEKSAFHLPEFIAATGIEKIRQAYVDKEDTKKLKQKQREKMQPKMGKMDIDYQVLHDAFFKYQTKPKLTGVGDLYYEGKEFESKRTKDMRPGYLSAELRNALGMPDGAPPPWLINMQRFGPPPSYPKLVIPGLNAPIPQGASFGYHPGGWGKPPVDDYGRPLYGDVFGVARPDVPVVYEEEPVDRSFHWGDLEEQEEEEEEEEEQEEEQEEDAAAAEEDAAASSASAMEDGISSVDPDMLSLTGMETPDVIDLRKQPLKKDAEEKLYQVLEEKSERVTGATLLGTTHTYVVPGKKVDLMKNHRTDNISVTIQPEELEKLDGDSLAAKFEEAKDEKHRVQTADREDFSDLVAEVEKKRKRKAEKDAKTKKFKF